jgi:orotate phosphoribosyltransferase
MPIHQVQHDTASVIASHLLKIEAIKLNTEKPFTWASGIKSPIYCDNRVSLSYPAVRTVMKECLVNVIREHYPEAEAIAGVATAGIPQGALVADAMGLPFAYVRSSPKDHGLENLIEGRITAKQKVVVIEDLISTGGSSLKAVEALRKAGAEVLGMASIFTYGFDSAQRNFHNAKVSLVSLSDFNHLLTVAVNTGYITNDQLVSLKAWRFDPAAWK